MSGAGGEGARPDDRFRAGYVDGRAGCGPEGDDEGYVDGYVEGGFARLEEGQPGISEAMSYEFTTAKFSPDDIVLWLREDPETRFYGTSGEYRPG